MLYNAGSDNGTLCRHEIPVRISHKPATIHHRKPTTSTFPINNNRKDGFQQIFGSLLNIFAAGVHE